MELGQTVAVGILDDEGVDVGDVHTGLDDGGAHEDIHLVLQHLPPDLRQLLLPHLAMGHGDAGLRNAAVEGGGRHFDIVHSVVEIVHLPVPAQFPPDSVRNDPIIVLQHIGLHRAAILGSFLNDRHIPDAGHRHIQRPRNGRSRQGEHVHIGGHLLDALLLRHAEALLLVHDEQPQVTEGHVR